MYAKSVLTTVLMGLLAVSSASASSSFRWSPGAGSLKDSGANNLALGQTVLTFLSTDQNVNALVSGGAITLQNAYGPDDQFYKAMATVGGAPGAGRYITDYMTEVDDSVVGKFAYAIVLNMPFASYTSLAAIPTDGSILGGVTTISKVVGVNTSILKLDTPQPGTPQSFDGGAVVTNLQIIPEPTGAALILVGLGVVAIRRRRARNA